jgi:hypothetical protein
MLKKRMESLGEYLEVFFHFNLGPDGINQFYPARKNEQGASEAAENVEEDFHG